MLKRITKDRILFTDEIKTFKIIDFSKLNNKNFKLETIEERKKARYKYYYKTGKRLINLKKYTTSEKVITIILFMLLSIVLVLGWWAQEKKDFSGWPLMYSSVEELEEMLQENDSRYYVLYSSYGMTGWVLAERVEIIDIN